MSDAAFTEALLGFKAKPKVREVQLGDFPQPIHIKKLAAADYQKAVDLLDDVQRRRQMADFVPNGEDAEYLAMFICDSQGNLILTKEQCDVLLNNFTTDDIQALVKAIMYYNNEFIIAEKEKQKKNIR